MDARQSGRLLNPNERMFLRWMNGFYPNPRRIGDDVVKQFAHLWKDEGMVIFTPSIQAVALSEYGKEIVDEMEGRKSSTHEPTETEVLEFERRIRDDAIAEINRLRTENADLRQRLEDTDALLIIARAERDTARETQEQLQGVVTAQEAEIARLWQMINDYQTDIDSRYS